MHSPLRWISGRGCQYVGEGGQEHAGSGVLPRWRAYNSPRGLKFTKQPLHSTATLNIPTMWPSQHALTANARTNAQTLTRATNFASRCNTNSSPRSGSPTTALRWKSATRKNANKFGAMGKQTGSPRWPRAYPCWTATCNVLKILGYLLGPAPLRRDNGSSNGGVLPLRTVRTWYPGCGCLGIYTCHRLNGFGTMYDWMVGAHHGAIPPPNVSFPAITVPLSTNASYTA